MGLPRVWPDASRLHGRARMGRCDGIMSGAILDGYQAVKFVGNRL